MASIACFGVLGMLLILAVARDTASGDDGAYSAHAKSPAKAANPMILATLVVGFATFVSLTLLPVWCRMCKRAGRTAKQEIWKDSAYAGLLSSDKVSRGFAWMIVFTQFALLLALTRMMSQQGSLRRI